jgi:hypothetical protein
MLILGQRAEIWECRSNLGWLWVLLSRRLRGGKRSIRELEKASDVVLAEIYPGLILHCERGWS